MPVFYDKLRKLLIDKKMKRTELKDAAGISFNLKRCTKNAEKVDKRGKYRYYICADNGKAGVCQHSIF